MGCMKLKPSAQVLRPSSSFSCTPTNLMISMIPLLLLLLCPIDRLAAASPAPTRSKIIRSNAGDRRALLAFRSTVSDPSGALSSWNVNASLDFCGWQGVACSSYNKHRRHHRERRVTGLDLESLGLSGPISPAVANLTFLHSLYLQNNNLQGPVPRELGLLTHLRHVNLSFNPLGGTIPSSLFHNCSKLQTLSMWRCKLRGVIPRNISSCRQLRVVVFRGNELQGEIPSELSSLSELTMLNLDNNKLDGSIPLEMGNLVNLLSIFLQGNRLTGSIPNIFGNVSSLLHLNLESNNLGGLIPPSLWNLSSLLVLDLANNQLEGVLPPEIGNLVHLHVLYMPSNLLTGTIPSQIGNLSTVTDLSLSFNKLKGEIPPSLWQLRSLVALDIQKNQLSGTLPPQVGNLNLLQNLFMSDNRFSGRLPASLSNASNLQWIQMSTNNFSGEIPARWGELQGLSALLLSGNQLEATDAAGWGFMSTLSNCTNLQKLEIGKNNLGGTLPRSIANLTSTLETLQLNENHIGGTIPEEIWKLKGLSRLNLQSNLLTGNLPLTIGKLSYLETLNLNENNFKGEIPITIGNLSVLSELYLYLNALEGYIPPSLGKCPLEDFSVYFNKLIGTLPREVLNISTLSRGLDISSNSFTGSLPLEIGNLRNLGVFYMNDNRFSGTIPSTLGECIHLETLDMSQNSFQGPIPGSFSQLKGLRELVLSKNNLSGKIPDYFADFHFLINLNLSFNNFEGEVPKDGIFQNKGAYSLVGNSKLCGGIRQLNLPPCPFSSSNKKHNLSRRVMAIILVSSVLLGVILLVASFIILKWIYNLKMKPQNTTPIMEQHLMVSYNQLLKATDGFSSVNLIGVGSFGSVYKGNLNYGEHNVVAIKVLNTQQKGASRSFMAECETLRLVRHRNLVKILTTCSSIDSKGDDFIALIYDFMANGSLEKWLHPPEEEDQEEEDQEEDEIIEEGGPKMLNILQRLNILIDVASALGYLHHYGPEPIVHCDLKPSNILLDIEMVAHVGDFGLARFLSKSSNTNSNPRVASSSLALKGTVGYVAPEYGVANKVSTEGDVYGYGILVLEMFTGRRPTDEQFKEGLTLHHYVKMALPEGVFDIVDAKLQLEDELTEHYYMGGMDPTRDDQTTTIEIAIQVLDIGIKCSMELLEERMLIGDAIKELTAIRDKFVKMINQAGRRGRIP